MGRAGVGGSRAAWEQDSLPCACGLLGSGPPGQLSWWPSVVLALRLCLLDPGVRAAAQEVGPGSDPAGNASVERQDGY